MKTQNSNCDKTQKLKLQQKKIKSLYKSNSCDKIQYVTKLKHSSCCKTNKLNLQQNSKTQIVTKLKNL